ncbi:MAG: hypothetical protein IJO26_00405, partial [Clostridium sp.]|nr:hypothetical protein [Clostridium sp.]
GMMGSHKEGVVMGVTKLLDYYVLPKKNELARNADRSGKKVNIVGATPLDISEENLEELRNLLESRGYEVVSILSMSNDMDQFLSFYKADVNLAITQSGALIAKDLEAKYDMPYLAGLPVGDLGTEHYFNCLERVFEEGKSMEVSEAPINVIGSNKGDAVILEDGIIASSIRMELLAQGYENVHVVSMFGKDLGMSNVEAKYTEDEEEIMDFINMENCTLLVADPILTQYREKKDGIKLVELPKYAISSKLTNNKKWVYIGNNWNRK